MNYKKLKQIIIKANPEIIQEFEENESITEQIGCFTRQFSQLTGRTYTYERDIRLADVLLAVYKDKYKGEGLVINHYLNKDVRRGNEKLAKLFWLWNLKDDNLDNQSEETKQFLIDLLIK